MIRRIILVALVFGGTTIRAQVPVDQLAKPPADAQIFSIVSTAGTHGKAAIWTAPDGRSMSRESILLRGQVWETDQSVRLGSDGMPSALIIRGVTPQCDAAETFTVAGGIATWKSPVDAGSHPYQAAFYVSQGGPISGGSQLLIEAFLKSPDKSLPLLPGGRAHAERLTDLLVGSGPTAKTVTAWAVTGLSPSPLPVWVTAEGRSFGAVGFLSVLPVGYEGELENLDKARDEALAARSPRLLKALLKTPTGPVAFSHVHAFLDGTHFADDQTIVVDKGLITQVGPAGSVSVPKDAQVFDGTGETLVPGLWDSHMHVADDFSGPSLLALGITSVRDPGNDNKLTIARAKRGAQGELVVTNGISVAADRWQGSE